MSYVEISKEQFEETLKEFDAKDFTPPYGTTEYVYRIEAKPKVVVMVYSSVSTVSGYSRNSGEDAIRLALLYEPEKGEHEAITSQFPIGKAKHINRVPDWEIRLKERIIELIVQGKAVETCPRDSGVLKIRESKYGKFLGCVNYPDCRYTKNIVEAKPIEHKS